VTISTGTPIPAGLPTTAAPDTADRTDDPGAGADSGLALVPGPDVAGPDLVDTGPVPRLERLREALPGLPGPGLTVAGGTVLGAALVGFGAGLDLALGEGLGLGFRVTFVVTCVVVAFALRVTALPAAVVLPPLLYAGAAVLQTLTAGQTTGRRAAALDVATTLALSAPPLFLGTILAAAIAVSRGLAHLVRR
jgi:uncharacterized protein DUF6542